MAKDAAKPETDNAPKGKSKGKLILIIVIVLLALLIVVIGGVVALVLLKKGGGDQAAEAAPPAAVTTVDLSKPPTFVPLDPFTVNLRRDEGDHYLQVAVVLRVADPKVGDGLKAFMPEIRHRVNMLLSSKLPSELATTEGREALAGNILEAVNGALGFSAAAGGQGGPIQAVLFNSFIIQ